MSRYGDYVIPRGTTILLGVVGPHEDEDAQLILESVTAWMMTHPSMPLLPAGMWDDCLQGPPGHYGQHVEVRWLSV